MTTWTASPEPDMGVTAVRDRDGVRWRRIDDLWWGDVGYVSTRTGKPYDDYQDWNGLLQRGPLNDASNDSD